MRVQVRAVEIKYISHNYNVQKSSKNKRQTMLARLVRCCSQWLQIVTCSIRDPNAGIGKVPLANETQTKKKSQQWNHTVSRPAFTAAPFLRNQAIKWTAPKFFYDENVYNVFRKKLSVYSGFNLFCTQTAGGNNNKKSPKNPRHYFSTFFQKSVIILTQTF